MIQIDKPMPKGCDVCPLMYDYIQCNALPEGCEDDDDFNNDGFDWTKRPDWCPLKDQEAVKPKESDNPEESEYCCGICGYPLWLDELYCAHCGRRIKWESR